MLQLHCKRSLNEDVGCIQKKFRGVILINITQQLFIITIDMAAYTTHCNDMQSVSNTRDGNGF